MINWGSVTPQGNPTAGQEVASIGGLLSAIVDRRQKALEFQEQQELAVRRQEQEVRHQTELEDSNRRMLASQEAHQAAVLEQQKAVAKAKAEEEQRKASQAAIVPLYDAITAGNNDKARMIATGVGGSVTPFRPNLPDVPDPNGWYGDGPLPTTGSVPAIPPPRQPIEPPPMPGAGLPPMASPEDRGGPPPMPEAPPAPPAEPRAIGPDVAGSPEGREHYAAVLQNDLMGKSVEGVQKVELPGLQGQFMSALADERARIALAQEKGAAASDRFASTYHADTDIRRRVLAHAKDLLNSGALPQNDFADWVTKREQFLLSEEGKNNRMRVGASLRPPGIDPKVRELEPYKIINNEARQIIGQLGYRANVKDARKLQELATAAVGANDNAALAAIVSGAFTKYSQGGTGVVSDNDLKVFWQRIGGIGVRTMQAFQDAWDGTLGAQKQQIVRDALKTMQGASARNVTEMGEALVNGIGGLPNGNEHLKRILTTYVPAYYPVWMNQQSEGGTAGPKTTKVDAGRLGAALKKLK